MSRPSWSERMVALAEHWAQYSTCIRRQVGAVIYDPRTKAVLSLGYNDTAIREVDCGNGGCEACSKGESVTDSTICDCVHAEMNAVLLCQGNVRDAIMAVASLKDGVTSSKETCVNCIKHLKQAGISKVHGYGFLKKLSEESFPNEWT